MRQTIHRWQTFGLGGLWSAVVEPCTYNSRQLAQKLESDRTLHREAIALNKSVIRLCLSLLPEAPAQKRTTNN